MALATQDALSEQLALADQMIQLGQVVEARGLLKRLHKAHPAHTDTMLLLAFAERRMKHWPEAIRLLKQATALAPENTNYAEHLGMALMLSNDGRQMVQSIEQFARVLGVRPDFHAVAVNLLIMALRNDLPQPVLQSIAPLLTQSDLAPGARLHYAAACAIAAYLVNDTDACQRYVDIALSTREAAYDADGNPVRGDLYFMFIYAEFLRDLLAYRAANPTHYTPEPAQELHVIAESHCLTPAQFLVRKNDQTYRPIPHILMGIKAFFFTTDGPNSAKYAVEEIIRRLPKDAPLMFNFGELDCRAQEGLMVQHRRDPNYGMQAEIERLCSNYVRFVKIVQLRRAGRTYIAGVPAPHPNAMQDLQAGEEAVFTGLIRSFNEQLAQHAKLQELGFVDLYTPTLGENGWARDGVHIDEAHLIPAIVAHAIAEALL